MTRHWKKALALLPILMFWFLSTPEKHSDVTPVAVKKIDKKTAQIRDLASLPDTTPKVIVDPQSSVSKQPPPQQQRAPWEEKLSEALKAQSGGLARDIQIKRVSSFPWKFGGQALTVESVIVSLRNEQNIKTSFKALIDPSTGKILETWDQPVIDPMDPKENFGVRIDPRYHGF